MSSSLRQERRRVDTVFFIDLNRVHNITELHALVG